MNAAIQHIVAPVASFHDALFMLPAPSAIQTWLGVRPANGDDGPCGDRVLVLPLSSGRTAIIVVDVAGHGAARAPLSAVIAEEIITSLLADASPALALGSADARLRESGDEFPYAVAFVALVHPSLRTVIYASAGHDVAFTLADDGRTRNLGPTAPMLGIPLTLNPCDAVFTLGPAETLVIATDGISDCRPPRSERFFGASGIASVVARSLHDGGDPARAVLVAARAHAAGSQADDAGVVVARPRR